MCAWNKYQNVKKYLFYNLKYNNNKKITFKNNYIYIRLCFMSVIFIHNASWIAMLSSFRLILIILLINLILYWDLKNTVKII